LFDGKIDACPKRAIMMTNEEILKGNSSMTEDSQYFKSGGDDRTEKYMAWTYVYFSVTKYSK
jgi:hypothetical protein